MGAKGLRRNYFKVAPERRRGHVATHARQDFEDDALWSVAVKEKAARIMATPPMRIDFARFVFFDEHDEASIRAAWDWALKLAQGDAHAIAVYREPAIHQGRPWEGLLPVGETFVSRAKARAAA